MPISTGQRVAGRGVVFVQPRNGMLYRSILPISVPALVKRIPVPVSGYYASELPPAAVRTARVFLLPVHWYLQIGPAIEVARRLRAANPDAVIVTGGLSASLFPRELVSRGFDYVIRGDAEIPVQRLVQALAEGERDLASIPNLVGRDGFETPWTYALTREDIDANEYFDLDFFPTLQRGVHRLHRRSPYWPLAVYPFLMPFRGCPMPCEVCSGGAKEQQRLFRRHAVVRSADRVADDIAKLDADPGIRFLNIYADFLGMLPAAYSEQALRRRSRLHVQYEMATLPPRDLLGMFLDRFKGGMILFSADARHCTSTTPLDPDLVAPLVEMVQARPGYLAILGFNGRAVRTVRDYRDAVAAVQRRTRCLVQDVSVGWDDFPMAHHDGDPQSFEKFANPPSALRYPFFNLLAGLGVALGRVLPPRSMLAFRRMYHRMAHGSFATRLAGRPDPKPGPVPGSRNP